MTIGMPGAIGGLQRPDYAATSTSPSLEFPGEQGIFSDIYAQVREEEQVISLQFNVSTYRIKKRKQVDDATAIA